MPAMTLMIQGTASSVGKSVIVTALCRIFRQDGFRVAPFKAQNMALNSFVTREGGEIGRAQAVQAEAAEVEPSVYMNPVLLKPEADSRCQVIVMGRVEDNLEARQYYSHTPRLKAIVADALNQLRSKYDIVVMEGAGSPAEINLKEREIANMSVARMANAPVLLVGDIDRGGVFASLIGTLELLTGEERGLVAGLIVNKFRGDLELLKPGLEFLEKRAARPVLGVIPYFRDISIAQEDSVYLEEKASPSAIGSVDVAVIHLPHISNYDDFDPLEAHGCTVRYVGGAAELANPDLIILPGTKSTIVDLLHIRRQGLADAVIRQAAAGVPIIGICGGYQMLGKSISDPEGIEASEGIVEGLGLLHSQTAFSRQKTTTQVRARVVADDGLLKGLKGIEIEGYEIHMGLAIAQNDRPALQVFETPGGQADYFDGAVADNGQVVGTYMHGLFHNAAFTKAFLNRLRQTRGLASVSAVPAGKQEQYDKLAGLVRQHLDISRVYQITLGGKLD